MRFSLLVSPFAVLPCLFAEPPQITVVDDWRVHVEAGTFVAGERSITLAEPVVLEVPKSVTVEVHDERHERLPVYNPGTAGWVRGAKLKGLVCQECSARFQIDPDSVRLKQGPGEAPAWVRGKDVEFDSEWGTVGRLDGGAIGPDTPVFADYRHGLSRLDCIVVTAAGTIQLRPGIPHVANPKAPVPGAGDIPICTVYVTGRLGKLSPANLFPILELSFPEDTIPAVTAPGEHLTRTLAKLRSGAPLRVLAWGDSVTNGGYLPSPDDRWQVQFVTRLKERFPKANIDLIHLGWGGRNTGSFLAEPPGSPWNYQEKVLGSGADLVVSEFVNDAGLSEDATRELYGKLLVDLQSVGAEWMILTPHYVRPDWMGLAQERDCDDDPRPYVKGLRSFAADHPVALADASRRYGRLWRQGIPYSTLLLNAINHPDAQGMRIFADALMQQFPSR